jgi:hypothetical protein
VVDCFEDRSATPRVRPDSPADVYTETPGVLVARLRRLDE